MMIAESTFGKWFQQQRELLNLKQDEVARAAGIAKNSLSRIENGGPVSPEVVRQLTYVVQADEEEGLLRAFGSKALIEPDAMCERELRRLARLVPAAKRDAWIRAVRSVTEAITI
jgi:transcriptional regulator with XRE-family HTH domain